MNGFEFLAAHRLDRLDPQRAPGRRRYLADVPGVRGDHAVAAPDRAFHDRDIDHVVVAGLSGKDADVPGQVLGQGQPLRR